MQTPTDTRSSLRVYTIVWATGAVLGVVIAIAWSGLTGHSGDFSYETSIGWHPQMVGRDALRGLLSAACVLVFTGAFAPVYLRRFRALTVLLAFVAPLIGMPLLGRFVPGIENAPVYYFTVYIVGGLLAGAVAGTIAALAAMVMPPSLVQKISEDADALGPLGPDPR